MNYSRLENDLVSNICEAQLKLGYDERPMSLNYMSSTLCHLLNTAPQEDMEAALSGFSDYSAKRLGGVSFRRIRDGFCLTIPAQGTKYVHDKPGESAVFLKKLIETVSRHGISIEEVFAVFREFSCDAVIEESGCEDYDYLCYFPGGKPDSHRYCLTSEPCMTGGCHIIYHRFIPEDHEEMFGR